jgi:hypothetical protein
MFCKLTVQLFEHRTSFCVALTRRTREELVGLGHVARHTLNPLAVHVCELDLRFGQPLVRRKLVEVGRLGKVLLHPAPVGISTAARFQG